jgi:hypothetical protein
MERMLLFFHKLAIVVKIILISCLFRKGKLLGIVRRKLKLGWGKKSINWMRKDFRI